MLCAAFGVHYTVRDFAPLLYFTPLLHCTPLLHPVCATPLQLLRGFRSAVSLVERGPTLTVDAASAVVAGDGPLLKQLQVAVVLPYAFSRV